jgi:hypothetical protein
MIPPHAKYQRRERGRRRSKKKKATFDHFVRSQAAGAHKMAKTSPKTGYFRSLLCMRSDHSMIRPHAKYRRRERARSRSEKRKQRFTMLGSHKMCERP